MANNNEVLLFRHLVQCINDGDCSDDAVYQLRNISTEALKLMDTSGETITRTHSALCAIFRNTKSWLCPGEAAGSLKSVLDSCDDDWVDSLVMILKLGMTRRNSSGQSLLHIICGQHQYLSQPLVLDFLMSLCCPQDSVFTSKDSCGRTPLLTACVMNFGINLKQIVHVMLPRCAAAVALCDNDGRLPLHYVCDEWTVQHEVIRMMVDIFPGSLSQKECNPCFETPLHILFKRNDAHVNGRSVVQPALIDLSRYLVDKNPDALLVCDDNGNTPFHYVCIDNQVPEILRILVNGSPDVVTIRNRQGQLPIHLATERPLYADDVIQFLLSSHPKSVYVLDDGEALLHLAILSRRGERLLQCLMHDYGVIASVVVSPSRRQLPLHMAASERYSEQFLSYLQDVTRHVFGAILESSLVVCNYVANRHREMLRHGSRLALNQPALVSMLCETLTFSNVLEHLQEDVLQHYIVGTILPNEKLTEWVEGLARMNKVGRRIYLKTDATNRVNGVLTLSSVRNNMQGLYGHVRENALNLCKIGATRARAEWTRKRKRAC